MYSKSRSNKIGLLVLSLLAFAFSIQAQNSVNSGQSASVTILDSSKEQDGLAGSVRRVKVESAKLELKSGQLVEGQRQLLEITTYSLSGNRIENVSYPVVSSPVGKEEYKYDEKGNIVEMTLRGNDSSIISREAYDYEFDKFGNWKKMVTNLVVFEAGELKREPVEVTYRTLTYYFDEAVASLMDAPTHPTMGAVPAARTRGIVDTDIKIAPGVTIIAASAVSVSVDGDPPPPIPAAAKKQREEVGPVHEESDRNTISAKPETLSLSAAAPAVPAAKPGRDEAVVPTTSTPHNTTKTSAFNFYRAGREHFDSGDLKAALKDFQQSLELEPKSADANLSLGYVYLKLSKPGDAIKAFKQAIVLNPEMAEAYYGLGLNFFGMRRNKDAADAFKRAATLRPDMAKAHYGLALSYQELGKQDGLIEEYRILQTLDRALAKKLSTTFPEFNLPCRATPFCK
jgi:YD repeat-containing protein